MTNTRSPWAVFSEPNQYTRHRDRTIRLQERLSCCENCKRYNGHGWCHLGGVANAIQVDKLNICDEYKPEHSA